MCDTLTTVWVDFLSKSYNYNFINSSILPILIRGIKMALRQSLILMEKNRKFRRPTGMKVKQPPHMTRDIDLSVCSTVEDVSKVSFSVSSQSILDRFS